jgi:molecular chaperone DnaK (HSP70)
MGFIGIDFGTSNSLGCLAVDGRIEFVKFPDGGDSNPTILYFPEKTKQ